MPKLNNINFLERESNFYISIPTQKLNPEIASHRIINKLLLVIMNFNLVRQGSLVLNQFDLHEIYKNKIFNIHYNYTDLNSQKYQLKSIRFTNEKHNHLIMIVTDTFSNPLNCGYFLKTEIDTIFLLFTLSPESQMLFVKLLKKKLIWHRINMMKYPEISINLEPFVTELVQNGFCKSGNIICNSFKFIYCLNM
jgi:hypothetical protein